MMVLAVLVLFLLILLIRNVTYNRKILQDSTELIQNLTNGNFGERNIVTKYKGPAYELNNSLNRLARDMEKMERTYLAQEDQLKTLIENIGSGLVFIDDEKRVVLVNKSYRETFRIGDHEWRNKPYESIMPNQDISSMILESFATEKRQSRTCKLDINIYRKHFDVSCAPVLDHKKRIRGVVVLFHDITELKKLEQMRKDFVANVSHELKTPITSIIGFSETLLESHEDPDLTNRFLSIILYESKRLQNLVHDLLELSRIEQPHYSIPLMPTSLVPLINESLPSLNERAQDKDIVLHFEPHDPFSILGDASRLKQIIVNIVSNAIAYTPSGGRVDLRIWKQEKWGILEIKDTGIGIERKEITRIFERFYRVDKARSRDSGGTGLGLAIVKHLVEAHGGKIEVESQPGNGSTFQLYFLLA